jgi:hypothetical protein
MTRRETHLQSGKYARKKLETPVMEEPWLVWLDQAMFLCGQGRTVTPELRLAHYRAQRDTQRLPRDACFYSIAFVLTEIAEDRMSKANVEHDTFHTQHEALRASQRTPSKDSLIFRDAPEGSGAENAVCKNVYDESVTATFKEYGEYEMAKLFMKEPQEFKRRWEHGLRYLRGAKTHLHRWKLVNPYAFGGPVFICRKCSERVEQKD